MFHSLVGLAAQQESMLLGLVAQQVATMLGSTASRTR